MSFVLPGNARQLRFTGEAKAFVPGDETPGGASIALGKPRVRKATTTPPPMRPSTSSMTPAPMATNRHRSGPPASMTPASPGTAHHAHHPPHPSHRVHTPVPSYGGHDLPAIRQKSHSIDEEMATMALDREGLDILPGGLNGGGLSPTRPPPPPSGGRSPAPIPHFRPAAPGPGAHVQMQTVLVPNGDGSKPKGAPLALWVLAAVLAGILSYHVTPAIMGHFEAATPPPAKITPAI